MNPLLLNAIYDAMVRSMGDAGARARAQQWTQTIADKPTALSAASDDAIEDYLKDILKKGLPGKMGLYDQGAKKLSAVTNKAVRNLQEDAAASGINSPSVLANPMLNLYNTEASKLNDLQNNLNDAETQLRQQAVAKLLGISASKQSAVNQDRNYELELLDYLLQRRTADEEEATNNRQPDFWSLFGNTVLKGLFGLASYGI